MTPTKKEIKQEIDTLKRYRTLIPPRSFFGDNNLARIDAEIYVLQNDLSEQDIETRYSETEAYDSAIYARQWLDGTSLDGSMSENWKPLAEKGN